MKSEVLKTQEIKTQGTRVGIGSVISHVLLIIASFIVLFPFLWMVDTALKPNGQALQSPPSVIPDPIQWGNFIAAWTYLPFGHFIFNSLVVACIGTVLVLITSSAAYAF